MDENFLATLFVGNIKSKFSYQFFCYTALAQITINFSNIRKSLTFSQKNIIICGLNVYYFCNFLANFHLRRSSIIRFTSQPGEQRDERKSISLLGALVLWGFLTCHKSLFDDVIELDCQNLLDDPLKVRKCTPRSKKMRKDTNSSTLLMLWGLKVFL